MSFFQSHKVFILLLTAFLVACGGDSPEQPQGGDTENPLDTENTLDNGLISEGNSSGTDTAQSSPDVLQLPTVWPAHSETVTYRVAIFNDWGVENYPQDFPDDAHLSAIAGATHNAAVSFWAYDEVASAGIVDIAESGIMETFIDAEVETSIEAGGVDAAIVFLEHTGPSIDGVPGIQTFTIEMSRSWPLLTFATKLTPSPDWFVGLSSMSLYESDTGWKDGIQTTLPLMDGGSRSAITPMNGGPQVIPPDPISSVVYDPATGTYVTGERPSFVARFAMSRIR